MVSLFERRMLSDETVMNITESFLVYVIILEE